MTDEEVRTFYNSMNWRRTRELVRQRDNYQCQWCKDKGKLTIDRGELNRNGRKKNALIVHHIEELRDKPELRLEMDNLVTVCFECHERHHERWRDNIKIINNEWRDEQW